VTVLVAGMLGLVREHSPGSTHLQNEWGCGSRLNAFAVVLQLEWDGLIQYRSAQWSNFNSNFNLNFNRNFNHNTNFNFNGSIAQQQKQLLQQQQYQ
jgi:hypothetical protein